MVQDCRCVGKISLIIGCRCHVRYETGLEEDFTRPVLIDDAAPGIGNQLQGLLVRHGRHGVSYHHILKIWVNPVLPVVHPRIRKDVHCYIIQAHTIRMVLAAVICTIHPIKTV